MLAMGPRDLNSAPYSPVHCSSHSMTSFQSSELTELPVVENSQLFAQRLHSACTAHGAPPYAVSAVQVSVHFAWHSSISAAPKLVVLGNFAEFRRRVGPLADTGGWGGGVAWALAAPAPGLSSPSVHHANVRRMGGGLSKRLSWGVTGGRDCRCGKYRGRPSRWSPTNASSPPPQRPQWQRRGRAAWGRSTVVIEARTFM